MPQFSTEPPADPRGQSLELKRCPPGAPLVGLITCHDVVGCPTHFWGGRTVPCEEENCEPCLAGIGWLWHGYVSAWHPTLKLHFLFEMTARCVEPLTDYRNVHPSLRGCQFLAQRPSGKPNGRVYLKTKSVDLTTLTIPPPPDLRKVLAMIWNLPVNDVPVKNRIKNTIGIAVDRPNNHQPQTTEPVSHET